MKKALVIDDEADVRYIVQMSLGRVGQWTVVAAASGEEGIALAKSEQPSFVLLDMMMPGMDGAAVFRVLHADPQTTHIPVVFLTAKALAQDIQRLRALGAKGVILKPFDPMTLASEITAILEG